MIQKLEDQLEPFAGAVAVGAQDQRGFIAEEHAELCATISAAISLKRIADRLDGFDLTPIGNQLLDIAYQAGLNFAGGAKQ
jgi:hypothetical protein